MTCDSFQPIKYSVEISSKSDQRESNGMVIRPLTDVYREPGCYNVPTATWEDRWWRDFQ